MKKEQVKVGMVLYDKQRKRYFKVRWVCGDMMTFDWSDHAKSVPAAFSKNVRPLTARERGDTQ